MKLIKISFCFPRRDYPRQEGNVGKMEGMFNRDTQVMQILFITHIYRQNNDIGDRQRNKKYRDRSAMDISANANHDHL